jgi:adenylate kinase family enzyme
MSVLRCSDPLPHRPQRVLVAGASGSGKTTVAAMVSAMLGLPHTDIDGLYHGPSWVPRESFLYDVRVLAAEPHWVVEWQYRPARPLLLAHADTLVWLDLPRWRVLAQIVPRTVRRRLRRVELWNGNIEPPLWTILTDPGHVVRWSWRTHRTAAQRVRDVLAEPDGDRLPVVWLCSRSEVRRWLRGPLAAAARQ